MANIQWHSMQVDSILGQLGTDPQQGLTVEEVRPLEHGDPFGLPMVDVQRVVLHRCWSPNVYGPPVSALSALNTAGTGIRIGQLVPLATKNPLHSAVTVAQAFVHELRLQDRRTVLSRFHVLPQLPPNLHRDGSAWGRP
jgi:hypothetical protein